jgi:arginine utilization regulatory protein
VNAVAGNETVVFYKIHKREPIDYFKLVILGGVVVKDKLWDLDYVDSLMIVDKHLKVIRSSRYNPRFDDEFLENDYSSYVGLNFFEVYPSLSRNNSSMVECLQTGRAVYRENQIFRDNEGCVFNTCNLTFPINRCGEIVGAIELSKDITAVHDLEKKVSENGSVIESIKEGPVSEEMTFENIISSNAEMIENIRKAKVFSNSSNPTLIYGETGTGKEIFVQAMINYSRRKRKNYVALNCATVPENLIESILFGSVKGAYTGAENQVGLFELAHNGILFLDELNSMPFGLQAKILRVLEDGVIRPLGANKAKKVNIKVIAAMNIDPIEAIEKKVLREDLFYRLSSNTIKLVSLRERKEDILLYVNKFISAYNGKYEKNVEGLSLQMMDIFMDYEWKGNVRELKHIIESMVSMSEEAIITVNNLPIYMKDRIESNHKVTEIDKASMSEPTIPLHDILEKTEKELITKVLIRTNGQLTKAAEILCIPRQTLKYRMVRLGIDKEKFK